MIHIRQPSYRNAPMSRIIILATVLGFGALTAYAVWHDGITGIFEAIVHSYGSIHIYVDLVIALVLVMVLIWHDAKATGRNVWPWIAATLLSDSF